MIKLNGKEICLKCKTLSELLQVSGVDISKSAAEINGNIIPRSMHSNYQLQDKDEVNLVEFVGGG